MIDSKQIDKMDVRYVANLARMYLAEDEISVYQAQLDQVVEYVNQLKNLDLDGIEPTSHASMVHNVFRKDEVKQGLAQEVVLANAPAVIKNQFKVPKIVE